MCLLVSKAIYSHCCRRLLRSNYFLILRIRSACPIQCLQIYESALLLHSYFALRPHPLYIKKKLFLDILANDFSSSRLLGSTGKPDRAANRWPQFACLTPVSAYAPTMLSLFLGLWNLTGNLKIVLLLQQTVRQINLRPDSRVI